MGLQGYVGSGEDVRRIRRQEDKRQKEKEEFEAAKRQSDANIDAAGLRKFDTGATEALERAFKDETAGLVTRAEFLNKRDTLAQRIAADAQKRKREAEEALAQAKDLERKRKAQKLSQSKLSFGGDEDEEEDEERQEEVKVEEDVKPDISQPAAAAAVKVAANKAGISKNPHALTDFLPDRQREAAEENLREQLRIEYQLRQQAVRNELVEITYSYWDGSGHRRKLKVPKGSSIEQFLGKVREQLVPEFRELRATSTSDLLYVKEDLIIPASITFYDLIIGKARGKSGPLFHFDVHDDIRATNDATIEKDESHAGKVVDRHWYNRNKHIFPASRWETFDPEQQFDKYTVHGD